MEVIIKNPKDHPSCPHGPCLMFERRTTNGNKSGRKFFACSACRDRSDCNFFHWVDDKITEEKQKVWKTIIDSKKPKYNHEDYMKRLKLFEEVPLQERRYCITCSLLILPNENHSKHETVSVDDIKLLKHPTLLLQTTQNKKAEAQFFFSEKTVQFLISSLKKLNFSKLVLIGVPKLHEYLISDKGTNLKMDSFLMDIDYRYMQFFPPDQFCHYNLFNNHFFCGKPSKAVLKRFLFENNNKKVAVLLDPPFGGLVEPIAYSLKQVNKWWRIMNEKDESKNVPLLWFFPYFMEPRIIQSVPDMTMLDYKVEYLNHKKFGRKAGAKGSPIRIFTNISSSRFVLPGSEGYRLCKKCDRYVSKENQHCDKCNACTTKHGPTYKHCDSCGACVKSAYAHCAAHNKCVPPGGAPCACVQAEEDKERCFKCHGKGHRKRDCTFGDRLNSKKKKK